MEPWEDQLWVWQGLRGELVEGTDEGRGIDGVGGGVVCNFPEAVGRVEDGSRFEG
jgi:hypothetical protein